MGGGGEGVGGGGLVVGGWSEVTCASLCFKVWQEDFPVYLDVGKGVVGCVITSGAVQPDR